MGPSDTRLTAWKPAVWLAAIPVVAALLTWLTPLAFAPVPWPDDSAFYFVARELFSWPPRWVMLPQAPFEPSYRELNFNTMPLYPILIGLGRWIGIDGSHALKLWPLAGWAAGGALLVAALARAGLGRASALLIAILWAASPTLRWASVLVRPESLIAALGMALVLGLTLGFPRRLAARGLWDPAASLLALAAYAHFNSVHLVFAVVAAALVPDGRRPNWRDLKALAATGARTALYLSPWLLVALWKAPLFAKQMKLQWSRLAVGSNWFESLQAFSFVWFDEMGSPERIPGWTRWTGLALWALAIVAVAWGLLAPAVRAALKGSAKPTAGLNTPGPPLAPAAGWLAGAVWLCHTKPEVWFTHYMHASLFAFLGIALLRLHRYGRPRACAGLTLALAPLAAVFAWATGAQALALASSESWRWRTYERFVDCIDRRLTEHERALGSPRPYRVWGPTFPDVTIALSRRHPGWEYTRTNDFWDRQDLAIIHGHEVEAVVVPETIQLAEREVDAQAGEVPGLRSTWMSWEGYFLIRLWRTSHWKPERHVCQAGRWMAFLFLKTAAEPH